MPIDIITLVAVIAFIVMGILYILVMSGVLISTTKRSITQYRYKNKGIKESISVVKKEMRFKIISKIHIETFRAIKDTIMSFQGFRDIPEYDIRLHKMAQGSLDDATISFLNTTYNRDIEGVPIKMEQSIILITSRRRHLPDFSLRSTDYWAIYRPTDRDYLHMRFDRHGSYKPSGTYGLQESPYFKRYRSIFSERALEKMDDEDPFVRLSRGYTLAATDQERKKLRNIVTTGLMDTLDANPFMMIEGYNRHLLLMDGIGYYERCRHGFEVPRKNGYILGTHIVEKIKIAIDLARQLKATP